MTTLSILSESRVRDKFTVGLIQMSCGPEPADNLAKALDRVAEGGARGRGKWSVCPSFFRPSTSVSAKTPLCSIWRSRLPGTTHGEDLAATAKKHEVVLIASLFEKRAPGLYHNTAAIFDSDGELRGMYRKMHIPDDPLYFEKFYFTPGDLGFKAFDTRLGELVVLVCWDQWYPEGARLTCIAGSEYSVLPHGDRMAPGEKAESRRSKL